MKRVVLALAALAFSQGQSVTVGPVDFYAYDNLDPDKIRAALPIREGDQISQQSKVQTIEKLRQAARRVTGRDTSDVATICCDERGRLQIYVGLTGDSRDPVRYNPTPSGSSALSPEALRVYREADEAWSNAMQRGVSGEDDSRGFALSTDAQARAKQLALHNYAIGHEKLLIRVLKSAADIEQRQTAAEMLGYANASRAQVAALVHAGRDPDPGVRNNVIRALGVIARSKQQPANLIPSDTFIELLNSGIWTDRNKSAGLLAILTDQRDPKLLADLRAHALKSLLEMARWHSRGHAESARLLLGRIGGIEEKRLAELLQHGEVDEIVKAASTQYE